MHHRFVRLLLLTIVIATALPVFAQDDGEENDDEMRVRVPRQADAVVQLAVPQEKKPDFLIEPEPNVLPRDMVLDLPVPNDMGGLAVLPLSRDIDSMLLRERLAIPPDETIVLVLGKQRDRLELGGVRLQLPPPFLVVGLEPETHPSALLHAGEVLPIHVRCERGWLTVVDTDAVIAELASGVDEEALEQQQLMVEFFSDLGQLESTVEKIRLCMTFLEDNPRGEAADTARKVLANLRDEMADEDTASLDISDAVATAEMRQRERQIAIATAPRPAGARTRQVLGFTLLGGAVTGAVVAVVCDRAAADAATLYHQELALGHEAAAAPYLDQARRNDTGFRLGVAGAISAGATGATLLLVDRILYARWKKLRRDLGVDKDDDAPKEEADAGFVVVPAGLGVAIGGQW